MTAQDKLIDAVEEYYLHRSCTREAAAEAALWAIGWHDMLAACETVLKRLDLEPVGAVFPCSALRNNLRAAIAKAT